MCPYLEYYISESYALQSTQASANTAEPYPRHTRKRCGCRMVNIAFIYTACKTKLILYRALGVADHQGVRN